MRGHIFPDVPPLHLRRFNPADWPTTDDHGAYRAWVEQREAFEKVHGWPGGEVEQLIERRSERLRHFCTLREDDGEDGEGP